MNKIISIAGSSGVGKTTLAKLILIALSENNVTLLSGDNYHKWDRYDKKWQNFTHLNPKANDLSLVLQHLITLKNGKSISMPVYNHNTGHFNAPRTVISNSVILYEGLHALYDKSAAAADIKIFVDTDEDLKIEWKLSRDINDRGYTKEQVLHAIELRKNDDRKHIQPQKQYADIIVRFKKVSDFIVLEYDLKTGVGKQLMHLTKEAYYKQKRFVKLCCDLAADTNLVEHRGGNVSYKFNDKMIITTSGTKLSDVTVFKNYHIEGYNVNKPSMELGMHKKLAGVVVHTHPFYVNAILCSEEAESLVSNLFDSFKYEFIKYAPPGKKLCNSIDGRNISVLFLQNHGLVVSSPTFEGAWLTTKAISEICKNWIKRTTVKKLSHFGVQGYVFPDAAVFKKNQDLNDKLISFILSSGLTPKFLTKEEVDEIKEMEEEKYRSSLT